MENLNSRFEALCNEQEKLYKPEFEVIFKALYSIDEGQKEIYKTNCWNMEITLPDTPDTDKIKQAISKAGFGADEALYNEFTNYAQIVLDGKKIMQGKTSIMANGAMEKREKAVNLNEWRFIPISIIAPKPIINDVVNPLIEADAKAGKGLFANVTDIETEDEEEDALLMVKIYNCEASLTHYWDELKQFGVIGKGKGNAFFNYDFRTLLLKTLNVLATFISHNTDKPAQIKNHITNKIKVFDDMPIWGLFFQILILQGLCRWLEVVNINEGDNSINDVQSLYNWLFERLTKKETQFCYIPYGVEDKQRLKPLCNYLYSTELGHMVQSALFGGKEPQQVNNDKTTDELNLPSELNTERARKYFAKAIEAQYIKVTDNGLQWVFGGNKGQARLGYFCNKVYETPRPINKLEETFGVKKLSASISNAYIDAKRADVKKWRNEINDSVFND